MKSYYLSAFGCAENLLEAQKYYDFLSQNGFTYVDTASEADYIIIVTCGVTSYIANECKEKYCSAISDKKSDAKIIICGCLTKIDTAMVSEFDAFVVDSSKDGLNQIAGIMGIENNELDESLLGHQLFNGISDQYDECDSPVAKAKGELKQMLELEKKISPFAEEYLCKSFKYFQYVSEVIYNESYFVNVARGCNGRCSYCAVKFVKGNIISRDIKYVLDDIIAGYNSGNREIVLSGDDVGSYGIDKGNSFYDLGKAIVGLNLDISVTIRNFEPMWMINNKEKFFELLESGIFKSVCVPIQSGNASIVEKMNRKYQVDELLKFISQLREKFEDIIFSTHLMVGFPGEDEGAFNDTLALVKKDIFDFYRTSMYTDRPYILSSKMEGKIKLTEKMLRLSRLEEAILDVTGKRERKVLDGYFSEIRYLW